MRRALGSSLAGAGLMALGLWAWLSLTGRIAVEGGLAVGEPGATVRQRLGAAWPAGRPPEELELRAAGAGGLELLVDAEAHTVAVGEVIPAASASLRVLEVRPAPTFVLRSADGTQVLHEGVFKVSDDPERAAFFMIDVLPHRFYLRNAASGASNRFDLAIYRGKLRLADREVGYGEAVPVGQASFRLEPGVSWVRFEARRRLSLLWSLPGALLWVVGLGVLARRD